MESDRRAAPRVPVPDDVIAEIAGVPVRLIDVSLVGAKVEHEERFTLTSPQLTMKRRGQTASIAVRGTRSEIVGRRGGNLLYSTALQFVSIDSNAQGFVASIVREATEGAPPPPPEPEPAAKPEPPPKPSLDDTFTRHVRLFRDELDEHLPFAQFRLTDSGWRKEYVASPEQPEDGFTIPRERIDFHELQRTFEVADPETRRMMQVALESEVKPVR
jgi:hypothetical protein